MLGARAGRIAVALRVAAAVSLGSIAGGACGHRFDPPPPFMLGSHYVLVRFNGDFPPPARTIDQNGDSIHVYADTLVITFNATDTTYIEKSLVGRFKGFAAESIKVEQRNGKFAAPSDRTYYSWRLPTHVAGNADAVGVDGDFGLYVTPPGGTYARPWMYRAF